MSFVVITLGFILFNIVPTQTTDHSYDNDGAYHLASSADIQPNEDVIIEDLLRKDRVENQDGTGCKP